jgi:hypothetical protein
MLKTINFCFYVKFFKLNDAVCWLQISDLTFRRSSCSMLVVWFLYTVKKKRRMINPHFAFMTVKSVYEPGVPFHKPFFLEKVGKGL